MLHYGLEQLILVLPIKRRLDLQTTDTRLERPEDYFTTKLLFCFYFVIFLRGEEANTQQKQKNTKPIFPLGLCR